MNLLAQSSEGCLLQSVPLTDSKNFCEANRSRQGPAEHAAMQRRDFLRYSAVSVAGLTLGCGSSDLQGTDGSRPLQLVQPSVAATLVNGTFRFDNQGNRYEINSRAGRVARFSPSKSLEWQTGPKGLEEADLDTPVSLAVDDNGVVWVLDRGLGRLHLLDNTGQFLRNVTGGFASPQDVVMVAARVFVSDAIRRRVFVFDLNGNLLTSFGTNLNFPRGLAVDPAGRLHLADSTSVRVFSPEGVQTAIYGEGKFLHPLGVAIRQSDGLIVVVDAVDRNLKLFSPDLQSLGTLALSFHPLDIEFGPDGRLFVGGLTLED